MGVYNPFAELPNSCVLCESREKCDLYRQNVGRSVYRHNDCPLVEIDRPHGDILDIEEYERYGEAKILIEAEK